MRSAVSTPGLLQYSFIETTLTRDVGVEKCDQVPCDVKSADLSCSVTPNLSPQSSLDMASG